MSPGIKANNYLNGFHSAALALALALALIMVTLGPIDHVLPHERGPHP